MCSELLGDRKWTETHLLYSLYQSHRANEVNPPILIETARRHRHASLILHPCCKQCNP
ncbi:hypothetical protein CZ765_08220 [Corynebacterium casei]|nr:hypothetical protein CZ765_08220 [Corynebacterium casei]